MDVPEPCCVLTTPLDATTADALARQLKALADPVRLRIVSMIATSPSGDVCACDFPPVLDRSQPTVSHHLRQLVDADIIRREQRGKWAWFSLVPGALDDVRTALGEGVGPAPDRALATGRAPAMRATDGRVAT